VRTALFTALLAFAVTLHAQEFARLPPADKEEAERLLKIYRENTDQQARLQAVEMLANMSPAVVKAFTPILEKEWQTALTTYRAALPRLAALFVQKKAADPAFAKEVRGLREKLAKLRATLPKKEQLAQEAQPAIGTLRALHTVNVHDLVPLQLNILEMGESARALTRLRTAFKAKAAGALKGPDLSEDDLKREETGFLARAFWINTGAEVLKANAALVAKKAVPAEEGEAVRLLNEMRLLAGLHPLALDPRLHAAARDHSKDMATMNFFEHESPVPGKKTMADRAKLAGTTARAENIYNGSSEPAEVVQSWFLSPGHHVNMFANFRRIGVGRHEMHWTLMLGD
jgi:uncharacterized protein YkwD